MTDMFNLSEQQQKELELFHEIVPMTGSELHMVSEWIGEGHSPFSNPFGLVQVSKGSQLNFVEALEIERYRRASKSLAVELVSGMEVFTLLTDKYCRLKELIIPGWDHCCDSQLRMTR